MIENKPAPHFHIRQCTHPACRFRFPIAVDNPAGEPCPHCHHPTEVVIPAYTSHTIPPAATKRTARPKLTILLDNIRSTYNVGSIFRTADGVGGIAHIHLCGITPTPENAKVAKTALGAEQAVPWSQHRNGLDTAVWLQQQGRPLWAIEGGPQAQSLFDTPLKQRSHPLVLIVGNEIAGIDPGILQQCDRILAIPMQGIKGSLNVASAFAVAIYFLRYG